MLRSSLTRSLVLDAKTRGKRRGPGKKVRIPSGTYDDAGDEGPVVRGKRGLAHQRTENEKNDRMGLSHHDQSGEGTRIQALIHESLPWLSLLRAIEHDPISCA